MFLRQSLKKNSFDFSKIYNLKRGSIQYKQIVFFFLYPTQKFID